ncbi:helix-turn-helix domain-containing protein [uncultured Oscillibacter sp.]
MGKGVIIVRTLTLEDRRKIELMWGENASPVKIAAELGISQCTVYTELRRGQYVRVDGDVELDKNFRPAYNAERGETVYQRNLRNRGRRPKRGTEQKEEKQA